MISNWSKNFIRCAILAILGGVRTRVHNAIKLIKVAHIWHVEVSCLPDQKRKCPDFPICDSFWLKLSKNASYRVPRQNCGGVPFPSSDDSEFGLYCPPTEFLYILAQFCPILSSIQCSLGCFGQIRGDDTRPKWH